MSYFNNIFKCCPFQNNKTLPFEEPVFEKAVLYFEERSWPLGMLWYLGIANNPVKKVCFPHGAREALSQHLSFHRSCVTEETSYLLYSWTSLTISQIQHHVSKSGWTDFLGSRQAWCKGNSPLPLCAQVQNFSQLAIPLSEYAIPFPLCSLPTISQHYLPTEHAQSS